jgi:hypothetical protein
MRMTGGLSGRPCSRQEWILDERSWSTGYTPSRLTHHRSAGTLYVDGRWFAFTAGEDSPVGRMEQVWTWRASDEPEARDRHEPLVDAALRAASKEALGGES